MSARYRTKLWESYAILGAIVVVFLLSAPPSSALGSSSNAITSAELRDVTILDVMRLDISKIYYVMSVEGSLQLGILGSKYSFTVEPAMLGVTVTDESDPSMSNLASTGFFKGASDDGLNSLRATVTPDWMHFSFVIDGRDYFVDPVDGSGDSGYYALYSSDRTSTDIIDLSDDVLAPPDDGVSKAASVPVGPQPVGNSSLAADSPAATQASVVEDIMVEGVIATDSSTKNKTCGGGVDPEYRLARIIIASDIEYRNRYPGDWAARMITRMNDVCGRYEAQATVSFRLSINPWAIPNGQCPSTDAATLLNQFRNYMRSDPGVVNVVRDVSHLFTGKDLLGGTLGVSWEPGVGGLKWGFGDLAYSLSEQWHDDFQNMFVMGHELGHNFNGDHAYWAWVGGCMSWMCPTYGWPMTGQFSTNNANRVKSWAQQTLDLQKSTNPGPSSTSGDGLQSSNLAQEGSFIYLVGSQMTVRYDIKNVGTQGMTLEWLFVGARDASGTNRDFGHLYNVWIGAGQTLSFSGTYTPQSGGVWILWPAYRISGHYGPYMWITITPTVYYDRAHWIGVDTTGSSQNVDLFYRFYVLTTGPTSAVGSTVTVFVSMYNGQTGTGTTTFTYLFVGCRNAAQANKDFGHSGQQTLTQVAGGVTGGGWLVFNYRTLDSSGTWSFWPAYKVGSSYGPYQWHMLTLAVS